MKKIILITILLFVVTLNAITIGKIESIDNPETKFLYDQYRNSVQSYENRLIVSNTIKTEEYYMLPNGELELISFFDYSNDASMIYGDRFYIPKDSPNPNRSTGFYVFDLTQTPMELITYVEMYPYFYDNISRDNLFFSDSHIMVYDFRNNVIHLINNETFENEGFLPGVGGHFYEKYNDLFINVSSISSNNIRIGLFSLNENNIFDEISSIDIFGHGGGWNQINIVDDKIIMVTMNALLIIDISDVLNPIIENKIFNMFFSFHYTESLLFCFDRYSNLDIYEKDSLGEYQRIHTQYVFGLVLGFLSPKNINYVEPFIYLNAETSLTVFDTTKDYEIVNRHGNFATFPLYSVSESDLYYMEINVFDNEQKIYSLLDNSLIATLHYDNIQLFLAILHSRFLLINDRLYFSYITYIDSITDRYLDIYQIENKQATLINHIHLPDEALGVDLTILGDKVFFDHRSQTSVYLLENDSLSHFYRIPGSIQFPFCTLPKDYVLNIYDGSLCIRDINDLSKIIYEEKNGFIRDDSFVYYFDENHYLLSDNVTRLYSFDINNESSTLLRLFYTNVMNNYNEVIISTSNISHNNKSDYFALHNGQLVLIGSKDFGERHTTASMTYFFPEKNKMILVAQGGIWVYDFEYTEYVSDSDPIIPIVKTKLLGNYPNPFNPETTIAFTVGNAFSRSESVHVSIDIYNIRGQKVRSLLDGLFESGTHTVVWDGRDDSGRELGSGVYLYRMVAGEESSVRKMVLLK